MLRPELALEELPHPLPLRQWRRWSRRIHRDYFGCAIADARRRHRDVLADHRLKLIHLLHPLVRLVEMIHGAGDAVAERVGAAIGKQVAAEINANLPASQRLGSTETASLSIEERASLIDSQSLQLKASILRVQGNPTDAAPLLQQALSDVIRIRNGRVTSVIRLRGQILTDLALTFDAQGDTGNAQKTMLEATLLLDSFYPRSAVSSSARARYAGLLAKYGNDTESIAQFRSVVSELASSRTFLTGFGNLLDSLFWV